MDLERSGGIMDFANRGNSSTQQSGHAPQASMPVNNGGGSQQMNSFQPKQSSPKKGFDISKAGSIVMLIAGVLLIIALILGLVFTGTAQKESELIDHSLYQAVFLDSQDGQVYFGQLEVYNEDLYRLTDIFYVRIEEPLQPEGVDQQQVKRSVNERRDSSPHAKVVMLRSEVRVGGELCVPAVRTRPEGIALQEVQRMPCVREERRERKEREGDDEENVTPSIAEWC